MRVHHRMKSVMCSISATVNLYVSKPEDLDSFKQIVKGPLFVILRDVERFSNHKTFNLFSGSRGFFYICERDSASAILDFFRFFCVKCLAVEICRNVIDD